MSALKVGSRVWYANKYTGGQKTARGIIVAYGPRKCAVEHAGIEEAYYVVDTKSLLPRD